MLPIEYKEHQRLHSSTSFGTYETKMLRFACFALLVTLAVGLELQAKLNSQWQSFKSAHGKKYSGVEEEKRKNNFKSNVEAILRHNLDHDLGDKPYTLGVNEFSDMDHDEFVKTMLGLKVPANYSTGNPVFEARADAPMAAIVDWTTRGAVTPVKNQGSCGSCWTFATTATIEGAYAIKYGSQKILSEQHLVDCASSDHYGNYGCDGGLPDNAMQYVIDNGGINEDRCYRYVGIQQSCHQVKSCNVAKMTRFVDVRRGDESALAQAVTKGPVAVGIDAGQRDFQSYRSGVYAPSYCSQQINHAVTIVGYGNEGGYDYWKVKNSWGTSWGEAGYIKMVKGRQVCGITSLASYAEVA